MKLSPLAAGLTLMASAAVADTPVLTIYTYDSFTSDWGPGPVIEENFEAICDCDLQFIAAGDGAALLSRLMLEGERTDADVVLGLDTNLTAAAAELMVPHGITPEGLTLPVAWDDPLFLPYDWGYFAFVHRTDMDFVPGSFTELGSSDVRIVIQDPRSSTPGLGLLMWIEAAYGEAAGGVWGELADNVVTVTPGWSEAYGLFLEGEADMVLSYTTSPAYHLIAEEDAGFDSAWFAEGHYMQVEVAGILAGTDQPELAQDFLTFMLQAGFQDVIPTTNWMYPAAGGALPEGFETLIEPARALLLSPEDAAARRDAAIATWTQALSR